MDSTLTYQALRRTLRPPRVAIVFDGSEEWRSWAALAMYTAGQAWGGVGFVLVPHVAADVHPALLRMIAHYDPDYVVSLACSPAEFEAIHPGRILINGTDGQPIVEPAERARSPRESPLRSAVNARSPRPATTRRRCLHPLRSAP